MVTTLDIAPLNLIQADVLVITPSIRRRRKKRRHTPFVSLKKKTRSRLLASVVICIWDWVMGFHSISFRSRWFTFNKYGATLLGLGEGRDRVIKKTENKFRKNA
jgi:hypothetical protein